MAMRTKTTLFNAALLRCGRSPQDGADLLLEALEANYDDIVRASFESGDGAFPFGRAREVMTSRAEGHSGFTDAYVVPESALHVIEVYLDGCACSDLQEPWTYSGEDRSVLVNAGTRKVEVAYVKSGLEGTWSASFALAVQRRLEAVIKDVLEEVEESSMKESEADAALLIASVKGSRNRSANRAWKPGRLIRRRFTPDRGR